MCFGGSGEANVSITVLVRRLLSPSLTWIITASVTPYGCSSLTISPTLQLAMSFERITPLLTWVICGTDLNWHSHQLSKPEQHFAIGRLMGFHKNVPFVQVLDGFQSSDLWVKRHKRRKPGKRLVRHCHFYYQPPRKNEWCVICVGVFRPRTRPSLPVVSLKMLKFSLYSWL